MTQDEFEDAVRANRDYLARGAAMDLEDWSTAEDIVQQTLLELIDEYPRFELHGPASTRTWMTQRLRSRCIDEQRRRRRHAHESLDSPRQGGKQPYDHID